MRSLTDSYLDALTFTAKQASTIRALGEYRGRQKLYERQNPGLLEGLRAVAKIESTDASNRREGSSPEARLQAIVRHSEPPLTRSEQEIAGYRDALELIHPAGAGLPVSVDAIRQLHQTIHSYLPDEGGQWKPVDHDIVEMDAEGNVVRVRFRPVSASATSQAMADLATGYAAAGAMGREPLLTIPLLILDFLCIHPFPDGNGRVARLLTLAALSHAGYDVGRYISLERVIQESWESYYQTLEASSQGWHEGRHDSAPWLGYFWDVMLRAYKEFEARVGNVDKGRSSKSQRVRDAVGRSVEPFRAVDLEKECPDVSRETIRMMLREMKTAGLIELSGRGRGARWRNLPAE